MMREDHKIPTDGAQFSPCGWCHACGGTNCVNTGQNNTEDHEGTEICTDKKVNQLFHQTGMYKLPIKKWNSKNVSRQTRCKTPRKTRSLVDIF